MNRALYDQYDVYELVIVYYSRIQWLNLHDLRYCRDSMINLVLVLPVQYGTASRTILEIPVQWCHCPHRHNTWTLEKMHLWSKTDIISHMHAIWKSNLQSTMRDSYILQWQGDSTWSVKIVFVHIDNDLCGNIFNYWSFSWIGTSMVTS